MSLITLLFFFLIKIYNNVYKRRRLLVDYNYLHQFKIWKLIFVMNNSSDIFVTLY